jgi:hypothetical protein
MGNSYKYDVFISHAVEDKISIATELCARLKQCGLEVWYSGSEFNIGDSIEKAIFKGLAESRFCVVIISPNYLSKQWTIQEFHALLYKERDGEYAMLPILHNITLKEISERYPFMADRWCIPSDKGIDLVVDKILKKLGKDRKEKLTLKPTRRFAIRGVLLASVIGLFGYFGSSPLVDIVNSISGRDRDVLAKDHAIQIVESRIRGLQSTIENQHLADLKGAGATPAVIGDIDALFSAYHTSQAHYRNEYEFQNGFLKIDSRKRVEAATGINLPSLSPQNNYNFKSPQIYLLTAQKKPLIARYALVNSQPLEFDMSDIEPVGEDAYSVVVSFKNNIRYITVNLVFADSPEGTKRHQMTLVGFLPEETYIFRREHGKWILSERKE